MKTETFDVNGMSCASCVAHVEKAVTKLPGMMSVQVNLLTNSMSVKYDETELSEDDISHAVEDAGYEAIARKKEQSTSAAETAGPVSKKKILKIDEETLKMKTRWQVSFIFLIPLLYISMGAMAGFPLPGFLKGHENALSFTFVQFLLTLPVYIINEKYFRTGFRSLVRLTPNMDSLIAIGSSAALLYGIFAIFRTSYGMGHGDWALVEQFSHEVYFESGATILALITLGKYLEARSKSKTSDALSKLIDLSPQVAVVVMDGVESEVAVGEVRSGDVLVVKSGQQIPVDGVILKGSATVDESSLTGESMPVYKQEGDQVLSASMNQSGYFTFRATKVGEDTTIARIISLVEEASASKAPISRLADKISAVFVPAVIGIAILATVVWLLLGYPFDFALSIGIAVLVISCPCALGLATPVAIMVGTGKAASQGMLIKSAEVLETGHKVDTIVLDKTGTLTTGKPTVTRIIANRFFTANKLLEIAAALEKPSEHPLAGAVLDEAAFKNIEIQQVENFRAFPGMGVSAELGGRPYYAGNLKMMEEAGVKVSAFSEKAEALADEGSTPLFIANATEVLGVIAVTDVLKPDSARAVKLIEDMGLDVIILTGDHVKAAETIRKKLGVKKVVAEVLPHEKESEIRKLQEEGRKVAMVGDGINDAPALMRSDLGIAIGAGADIAVESADVVLIGEDLSAVVSFLRLSKRVMQNIKQNLFWAFFYNVLGIPLAAGVFYGALGWKLSPMFAAAAMSLSSVTVVLNALRIRKKA